MGAEYLHNSHVDTTSGKRKGNTTAYLFMLQLSWSNTV